MKRTETATHCQRRNTSCYLLNQRSKESETEGWVLVKQKGSIIQCKQKRGGAFGQEPQDWKVGDYDMESGLHIKNTSHAYIGTRVW